MTVGEQGKIVMVDKAFVISQCDALNDGSQNLSVCLSLESATIACHGWAQQWVNFLNANTESRYYQKEGFAEDFDDPIIYVVEIHTKDVESTGTAFVVEQFSIKSYIL